VKIELESAPPHFWHVHVDGKYIGRYAPKDWQLIEENPISLELILSGRLYLDSPREAKAVVQLIEDSAGGATSKVERITDVEAYRRKQEKWRDPLGGAG
jgi:hypothetical protein